MDKILLYKTENGQYLHYFALSSSPSAYFHPQSLFCWKMLLNHHSLFQPC